MADRPNDPSTASTAAFKQSGINSGNTHKAMDAQGAVGKQFTGKSTVFDKSILSCTDIVVEQGVLGGAAEAIGGPLSKEGAIGKQFTTEGSIGGTVQDKLGGKK